MDSIFAFFFKYRPALFRQGDIMLRGPWPFATLAIAALAVAAIVGVSYMRPRGRASTLDRGVMAGLRASALGVVVLCLLQPTLVLRAVVPQRNFVGILIDDSRSMTMLDANGRPRSAFVTEQLGREGALIKALSERFAVRTYSFSSTTGRVTDPSGMTYEGTRTDLAGALDRVREDLSSVPLSGLVVVSDGADNGGRVLAESLVPLQAASIPVFTVGLGEEMLAPDVQVDRVQAPQSLLLGSAVVVDVVVSQRGYEGRTVTLQVADETTILAQQQVELGEDGEPVVARVRFTADQAGPRRLSFSVAPSEGERVAGNNRRELVMNVRDEREKVLYFEGEPRFEVKFMRRAVEGDDNLQLVVLQRTAPDKFLRLDVDGAEELQGGFPKTREELFRYQGLILGSIEAGFFTHDQLLMIHDFVSQRGGGLLVLGGRHALAEGGYAGTPLADVIPVVLGPSQGENPRPFEVKVSPTPAGAFDPATQIAKPGEAPSEVWGRLPPLTTLNPIARIKAGATTLLVGKPTGGTIDQIVLAWQRFGRGRAFALPVQDTWLWQMHADVPLEDESHERFWRQLLRSLVDGVGEPVTLTLDHERAERGEPIKVSARVRDSTYIDLNDAGVSAHLTAPSGATRDLPLEWSVEDDGLYSATFVPDEEGSWSIEVGADRANGRVGTDQSWVRVGPGDDEFFDAAQRAPLLERIAEETGGRSYTAETVASLPEDLQYAGAGVTMVEERDLWDMPIFFLMLVGLIGGEWALRRRRGLV
ncbi:MAG: hypothetical protein EXR95_05580 [Gemmatimonadetes bacterium]|nr:hypothetical protein [Gemmatimonadota bacterium]